MNKLTTSTRSLYGNSVKALHNETPDAPLEISDEEPDQAFSSPPKEPATKRPHPSPNKPSPNSQRPTRPSERLIGKKHDRPPPVIIEDPEEQEKQRRLSMPYRLVNTLHEPRHSARAPNGAHQITRRTPPARKPPYQARDNNHSSPNKKRRTGPSPKDVSQHDPIPSTHHRSVGSSDKHAEQQSSRLNGYVDFTPAKQANELVVIPDSQSQDGSVSIHTAGDGQSPPRSMQKPTTRSTFHDVPAEQGYSEQTHTDKSGPYLDDSPDPLQKPVTDRSSRKRERRISISQSSRGHANVSEFAIKDIAGLYVPRKQDYYLLCVDRERKDFWISVLDPTINTDPVISRRPLSRILRIMHGANGSKLQVKLSSSHDELGNEFVVELESHKKVHELLRIITAVHGLVDVKPCDDKRLDSVLEWKIKQGQDHPRNEVVQPNLVKSIGFEQDKANNHDQQGSGASDSSLHAYGSTRTRSQKLSTEFPDRGIPEGTKTTSKTTTGFISKYFSPRPTRSTRSTRQPSPTVIRTPSPVSPSLKVTVSLPKWSNPLAYPKESKKREVVESCDLLRLDEDQFLNDSLINFFIRYLQHRLELSNPDLLKKMHFFNTYFFDTLTKNFKGKREISHAGVARWTKNIDIFSRDFVVVPVNDNLHWYLALICNLSTFTRTRRYNRDDEEDDSTAEDASSSVLLLKDHTLPHTTEDRGQLQHILATRESFQELTLEDQVQDSENVQSQDWMPPSSQERPDSPRPSAQTSPAKPKGRGGKKSKVRKSLPKYDPSLPIIITLDSLGQSRGPAISALKQYVVLEAKDKKNLDIEREDLKGMTAKGIPIQNNYSDCGLYMCMYLEQFAADPYGFVKKILQREDADLRWPRRIRSEELRSRLRQLILDLHRQQEGHDLTREIPPLGRVMVELRQPSPDIIANTPPKQRYERTKASPEIALESSERSHDARDTSPCLTQVEAEPQSKQHELDDQGDRITRSDMRLSSSSSQKQIMDEVEQASHLVDLVPSNPHSPIVLDDSPERPHRRSGPLPRPGLLKSRRMERRARAVDDARVGAPIVDEQNTDLPEKAGDLTNALGATMKDGYASSGGGRKGLRQHGDPLQGESSDEFEPLL